MRVMGITPHHIVVALLHLRQGVGLATIAKGAASSSSRW
jgi:hypothetical protein